MYLRHALKLSYRDIQQIFDKLFGMSFVPASAMEFSHKSAKERFDIYKDLQNVVQHSKVIHADETHWRIDGRNAYLWYAGNQNLGLFHADFSRSSDVAVNLLGGNFSGGLIADSYAGYNAVNPACRQACLSHLIRKAEEVEQLINNCPPSSRDQASLKFCNNVIELFVHACSLAKDRKNGIISFEEGKLHIPSLEKQVEEICKDPLKHKESENLRKRITEPNRDGLRLFTFLKVDEMEPTNNLAEQALRLPVILRKITFGSRSEKGAEAMAINLSLLETGRKNNKDPIELFKTILLTPRDASIFSKKRSS